MAFDASGSLEQHCVLAGRSSMRDIAVCCPNLPVNDPAFNRAIRGGDVALDITAADFAIRGFHLADTARDLNFSICIFDRLDIAIHDNAHIANQLAILSDAINDDFVPADADVATTEAPSIDCDAGGTIRSDFHFGSPVVMGQS